MAKAKKLTTSQEKRLKKTVKPNDLTRIEKMMLADQRKKRGALERPKQDEIPLIETPIKSRPAVYGIDHALKDDPVEELSVWPMFVAIGIILIIGIIIGAIVF